MNPRPHAVRPLPNYELEITFSNGEVRIFDLKPHLDFGVFRDLKVPSYFNQVRVLDGALTWPNDQDICPDALYIESRL